MTGTERIKNKILEDAKSRAEAIVEQANREAEEILAAADETARRNTEEALKAAEAESAEVYRRMIAVAGLEGRKEILRAKQEVVDNAFRLAMEKIITMPDAEYQELLENMIVNAASSGNGEILLSKRDIGRIDSRFTDNINEKLKNSGKTGSLSLAKETVSAAGGFVLRYGQVEINGTLEILFGMLRPQLESEVVKTLFNE